MKIGLGVWDLTIRGGTQRQILELARHLQNANHEITIYCCYLNRSVCYPILLEGLRIVALHENIADVDTSSSYSSLPRRLMYYCRRYLEQFSYSRRLAAIVDPETELLNTHDHNAGWLGTLVKKRLNIPTVWMINDLPRGFFPRSNPIIASLGRMALSWNSNLLEKHIARSYDRLVVLDRRNQMMVRSITGLESIIIRSGPDISDISYHHRKPPMPEGPLSLLCVGALFPWRRYEDVISSVAEFQNMNRPVRLRILGNKQRAPTYANKLSDLAARLNVSNCLTLEDEVEESVLHNSFAEANVFLFPAEHQTWGLTVFEAMATGLPAVVSRGAGAHDVLTDRETAMLVNPRCPSQITKALAELWDNRQLYMKLSRNGRLFVKTHLGWKHYASEMGALFASLVHS